MTAGSRTRIVGTWPRWAAFYGQEGPYLGWIEGSADGYRATHYLGGVASGFATARAAAQWLTDRDAAIELAVPS